MALTANEHIYNGEARDSDGRLIVVTKDGATISGGAGGGSDPLSDGTPGGALPSKTLWIAGANGTNLLGLVADATGRLRTVVEGTPSVAVSNFPATQPVSGNINVSNFPATQPISGTVGVSGLNQADKSGFVEGTGLFVPVGGVLNEAITADPAEDQAAVARITPKRAVHTNLRNNSGTEIATAANPVRTDPTGTTAQPVSGTINVGNFLTTAASPESVRLSNGASFYDASQIRALTATDVVTANQGAPNASQNNAWFTRPRKIATYGASIRGGTLAAPIHLSNAFGAAGRKQFATFFHSSASTKTVKLRRVRAAIVSNTVADIIFIDLIRLTSATTPANGNPTITSVTSSSANGAAEVTILALPTTTGTEDTAAFATTEYSLGITAAASTVNPPPVIPYVDLYTGETGDDENTVPTMRAGVAEGWALTVYCSAASTVLFLATVTFTEE